MAPDLAALLLEAARKNPNKLEQFIYCHPVLFSARAHEEGAKLLETVEGQANDDLRRLLLFLVERSTAFAHDLSNYPIGPGPIEPLWQRHYHTGEISLTCAEELARREEVSWLLSVPYVRRLSGRAHDLALDGEWRSAVPLTRILRAAVWSLPDSDEAEEMRNEADFQWLAVATRSLIEVPDGRIYRSARSIGDELVVRLTDANNGNRLGDVLHRLGVLHLDPYVASRSFSTLEMQQQLARLRLMKELDGWIPEDEVRMPEPLEALNLARKYLTRAADVRTGHKRGLTLKALGQALSWSIALSKEPARHKDRGSPDEEATLIATMREALVCLDPDQSPHQYLAVLSSLVERGEEMNATDAANVKYILAVSLDDHCARHGPLVAIEIVVQARAILDEAAALDLSLRAKTLITCYADASQRARYWPQEVALIARSLPAGRCVEVNERGVGVAYADVRERAPREGWSKREWAAALIKLSSKSERSNEEVLGLQLLEEAKRVAPLFFADHAEALEHLRATLYLGEGVNSFKRGDWESGVTAYAHALFGFLDLDREDMSLHCLWRIGDLAAKGNARTAIHVINWLARNLLKVERALGDSAGFHIDHIMRNSISALLRAGRVDPQMLLLLLQMAKGVRFGAALYGAAHYRLQADQFDRELLDEIVALQASEVEPPADGVPLTAGPGAPLLPEDLVVSSYVRRSERRGDGTSQGRLVNLQQRYDARLFARLLATAPMNDPVYIEVGDVQQVLDERTVLVSLYVGVDAKGMLGILALALTREEAEVSMISWGKPHRFLPVGNKEQEVVATSVALFIAALRQHVQVTPLHSVVTRDAAKVLDSGLRLLLPGLAERLDYWLKVGKNHLLVIPHGPLHYCPLALLGGPEKPLADQWTVTYLPSLHLMTREVPTMIRRRPLRTLTAVGLNFEGANPFSLDVLEQAHSEARAIAKIFGTTPILEEDATKDAVIAAMQVSRFVHLATHGRHNAHAPSFQCVFLASNRESDGRLFAHEILRLDLRGVELLTLGACETALGRFDIGDNLRGLPASFLLAGVSTIIGTLWPVAPDPAELFFVTLYHELKEGKSKGEAFKAAQLQTRISFQNYCDWGVFYLMGDTGCCSVPGHD